MPAYAAYRGGLHVVDPDDGSAVRRLADHDVETLAVSSDRSTRLFAGTFDAGLHRSTDGGASFERVGATDIGPDAVTAVAVSPHDPDVVWVGTEPSRIFRSVDGGETFERVEGLTAVPSADEWSFPPRPDTHHVRWIEPSPRDPERWYVGVEAGALLVTPDGGETWLDRPPGSLRDNHTLATHPDAPDRVYSAAGDGYAESEDGGETWTHVEDGLAHGYVWGLAVDPGDPETVIASAASGASTAHRRGEAYLYRKQGGSGGSRDQPWERLDDAGVPVGEGTYRAVLAGGREAGELWALTNHGLHRSRDGGDSFEGVPVALPAEPARALAVV